MPSGTSGSRTGSARATAGWDGIATAGASSGSATVAVGAAAGAADAVGTPAWELPGLDDLDDALRAVPAVVGAQLLTLQASLARGLGSDNPFPAGEVNRVVQGVTVHPLAGT